MSNYRLDEESLLDYAKLVSAIRLEITQSVGKLDSAKEEKVDEADEKETGSNHLHQ